MVVGMHTLPQIIIAKGLSSDQGRHFVGPDLDTDFYLKKVNEKLTKSVQNYPVCK